MEKQPAPAEAAEEAKEVAPDSSTSNPADQEGYPFPLVPPTGASSSLLQRRASTNSPAVSPMPKGNGASAAHNLMDTASERRPSLAANVLLGSAVGEDGTANTEELTKAIARMSVRGTALAKIDPTRRASTIGTGEGKKSGEDKPSRHPLADSTASNDETE